MASQSAKPAAERMLTSGRAGLILGVTRPTVRRWAALGHLTVRRTIGGHGRYREAEVRALAASLLVEAEPEAA